MFDGIRVFTTCPQSKDSSPDKYYNRMLQVAVWSDNAGCDGMLIYADNSIIDPWVVAQEVLQATQQLAPLVAVQPVYMHPYSVAKKIVSLGLMYRRQVCLNLIAGGFRNDLIALGDPTAHDDRYARLIEYCEIIQQLLTGEPVAYAGRFYNVKGLRLTPALLAPVPQILMSGSSPAGRAAVIRLGVTGVEYPEPARDIDLASLPPDRGIRVGILADADHDTAWRLARERFPVDRRGQLAQSMALKVSDSSWHQLLDKQAKEAQCGPYWLWPYQQYATFCPYLVGDYQTVADEIARYLRLGYTSFILDIPRSADDLVMAREVFGRAVAVGVT
jgi:alkanesulfonate monooxygenase